MTKPSPNKPNIERLINQYGNELLRLCTLYLKDVHLAEDAVQDTFIKVYQNWEGFRGDCSEKTWITGIAMNVCRSQLRSAWYKKLIFTEDLKSEPAAEDVIHDGALMDEIMKLGEKYRQVILLYYYNELKTTEIAGILGISESAVTVRLCRARAQLGKAMKGCV